MLTCTNNNLRFRTLSLIGPCVFNLSTQTHFFRSCVCWRELHSNAKGSLEEDVDEALELFETIMDMEEEKGQWYAHIHTDVTRYDTTFAYEEIDFPHFGNIGVSRH